MSEADSTTTSKCQGCGGEPQQLHTCPFLSEIHDDHETLCNCCDTCQDGCLEEI